MAELTTREMNNRWKRIKRTHSVFWLANELYCGLRDNSKFISDFNTHKEFVGYEDCKKIYPDYIKNLNEEWFKKSGSNAHTKFVYGLSGVSKQGGEQLIYELDEIMKEKYDGKKYSVDPLQYLAENAASKCENIIGECKNQIKEKVENWFETEGKKEEALVIITERFFGSTYCLDKYGNCVYIVDDFFKILQESTKNGEKYEISYTTELVGTISEGQADDDISYKDLRIALNESVREQSELFPQIGGSEPIQDNVLRKKFLSISDKTEAISIAILIAIFINYADKTDIVYTLLSTEFGEGNDSKYIYNIERGKSEELSAEELIEMTKELVVGYQYNDTKLVVTGLSQLFRLKKEFFAKKSELCYLNYFVAKYLNELRTKAKQDHNEKMEKLNKYSQHILLRNCYEFCKSKSKSENYNYSKYYKRREYLGLACAEYASMIYNNAIKDEYFELPSIIRMAKELGCDADSLWELEADLYMSDILSDIPEIEYKQNFDMAYKIYRNLYASTQAEGLIDKILKCIKKAKNHQNANGEEDIKELGNWNDLDDLQAVWETAKGQAGDRETIQEQLLNSFKNEAVQLRNDIDAKRRQQLEYFSENGKGNEKLTVIDSSKTLVEAEDNAVYIISGIWGKATKIFLESVIHNRTNATFVIVLQESERVKDTLQIQRVIGNASNVRIYEKGYKKLFDEEELQFFFLDELVYDNENIFETFEPKHLHFLLLGENKNENLAFCTEIIQRACKKQYVYKRFLELTYSTTEKNNLQNSMNMDFSKWIDIKLDADTKVSEWYLDSLMSRYDKEFYVPITYISYEKAVVRELLMNYPLFLADTQSNKKPTYNIVILGDGDIAYEIVKGVLAVCVFKRLDLVSDEIKQKVLDALPEEYKEDLGNVHNDVDSSHKDGFEEFEKTICSDFSLTVIEKNASAIENRLHRDAPDFFRNRSYLHCRPKFFDLDLDGFEIVELFRTQVDHEIEFSQKEMKISQALLQANYFIVALDSEKDENAIRIGMLLRELAYRQDAKFENAPIISVLCKEGILDANINEFNVGEETYSDAWFRSYHLNQFGAYQNIYSFHGLYENLGERIAIELHCDGKEDGVAREKKMRDYYRSSYNRVSCDVRSLSIPYMFYCLLGDKMVEDYSLSAYAEERDNKQFVKGFVGKKWNLHLFWENIDTYVSEYNKVIKDKTIAEMMSILEHNRWLVYMALEGYTSVPYQIGESSFTETERYIEGWAKRMTGDKKVSKLHIAKIHPAMVTYSKLGEKRNIDKTEEWKGKISLKITQLNANLTKCYDDFVNGYYTRKMQTMRDSSNDEVKEVYTKWELTVNNAGEDKRIETYINTLQKLKGFWEQITTPKSEYYSKELLDFELKMEEILYKFHHLQDALNVMSDTFNLEHVIEYRKSIEEIQQKQDELSGLYEKVEQWCAEQENKGVRTWIVVVIENRAKTLKMQVENLQGVCNNYKMLIQEMITLPIDKNGKIIIVEADGLEHILTTIAKKHHVRIASKSNRYYNRDFVDKMATVLSRIKETEMERDKI